MMRQITVIYNWTSTINIKNEKGEDKMNEVIMIGRPTRDPEVRYSQGEKPTAFARFTLAINRPKRRDAENNVEQTADFIPCKAFGSVAEVIEKYVHQGTKLVVKGRIQSGSYVNKEGQTVYTVDVLVTGIEFAESGGNNNRTMPNTESGDGFMNIPDGIDEEGLPFN